MAKILILDDSPARHAALHRVLQARGHEVVHAKTFAEAAAALDAGGLDLAYLDHDLGDYSGFHMDGRPGLELNGTDVARYIARQDQEARPRAVIVHSHNPEGSARMVDILRDAGVDAEARRYHDPEL